MQSRNGWRRWCPLAPRCWPAWRWARSPSSPFVRKVAKPYGTCRLAEGAEVSGRRVLVVEDVVTSGGQIVISTRQLRELGARISDALCVIDRQEGGAETLAAEAITLHALFSRGDLDSR
jgi:orotate phosphoribosyltransferase